MPTIMILKTMVSLQPNTNFTRPEPWLYGWEATHHSFGGQAACLVQRHARLLLKGCADASAGFTFGARFWGKPSNSTLCIKAKSLGKACHNHLTGRGAIEICWLLYTGARHHLLCWLGHDQRVDVLTLNTITSLWWTIELQGRWCCCCHCANLTDRLGAIQLAEMD